MSSRQDFAAFGNFQSVPLPPPGIILLGSFDLHTPSLWSCACSNAHVLLDQAGLDLSRYMTYLSNRQQAIASNLANIDTPGYRTVDVEAPSSFSSLIDEASVANEVPGLAERNDGNNVSMDRETRLLAETSLKFNLATQMLRGELRDIRTAIEEGRSS